MQEQQTKIVLELQDITKRFPGVLALDNVSFKLRAGEIHALVGENGAGKSTLMKVLSGIYPKGSYSGTILLHGTPVEFSDIKESEQHGIAVIYQELALVPYLTVRQNLFLGNERRKGLRINDIEEYKLAQKVLERVGINVSPDAHVIDLGIGQQQLIEIAKALLKQAKILILDEPTAALNEQESENLLEIIRELSKEGVSLVFISHKLEEVLSIADSITILRDGRSIVSTVDDDKTVNLWSEKNIIKYMVGRPMEQRFPREPHNRGDHILSLRNWTLYHSERKDRTIINNLSLDVFTGEVLGIAGLMGSGRTELATSIFGTYNGIVTGEIEIDGHSSGPLTTEACIAKGIVYLTEDRKNLGLVLNMSVQENSTLAVLGRLTRHGLVVDSFEEKKAARKYCEELTIKTPSLEQRAMNLSGGNQQKLVLAKWIMVEPRVLILDEPTRGIDVGAKFEIYKIINRLIERGMAVIMISSELPEILGMSDRIIVFHEGQIRADLRHEEADPEKVMFYATGGIENGKA
ncbi:sugar ABC transporter ATP-binding protein [Sediminispirochaeta smaragdinae]|uniref:ABC transporter related protein n=1 Tax=Sediminispirochaeta smaragdinae (strain DSM 11293 / JCM 15392 / SEBR 4228) TaxID=573413 RepID=E1R6H1_SEDSS|nr:ATP-binding cassette domain-containing protein [Sediminispirochaeta smaragdinae]ADK80989.1 ABC transporter related protein [Sediminispirochaeta smaragdinae DSM 11293]